MSEMKELVNFCELILPESSRRILASKKRSLCFLTFAGESKGFVRKNCDREYEISASLLDRSYMKPRRVRVMDRSSDLFVIVTDDVRSEINE